MIKAFTLLETIIVMILTVIVIGIFVSGLNLFLFDFKKYAKMQDELKNKYFLVEVLKEDMDKSITISSENGSLLLKMNNSIIRYHFNNKEVVRDVLLQTDTFLINIKEVSYFINSKPVIENQNLIDKIVIFYFQENKEQEITLYKIYDESVLFEDELTKPGILRQSN